MQKQITLHTCSQAWRQHAHSPTNTSRSHINVHTLYALIQTHTCIQEQILLGAVYTNTFSAENGELLLCYGHLFTRLRPSGSLKMQVLKPGARSFLATL